MKVLLIKSYKVSLIQYLYWNEPSLHLKKLDKHKKSKYEGNIRNEAKGRN